MFFSSQNSSCSCLSWSVLLVRPCSCITYSSLCSHSLGLNQCRCQCQEKPQWNILAVTLKNHQPVSGRTGYPWSKQNMRTLLICHCYTLVVFAYTCWTLHRIWKPRMSGIVAIYLQVLNLFMICITVVYTRVVYIHCVCCIVSQRYCCDIC